MLKFFQICFGKETSYNLEGRGRVQFQTLLFLGELILKNIMITNTSYNIKQNNKLFFL